MTPLFPFQVNLTVQIHSPQLDSLSPSSKPQNLIQTLLSPTMVGSAAAMLSISSPCCSAFFRGDSPPAIPARGCLFIRPPPARRAVAAATLHVSAASKITSAETEPVKRPARGITKPKPISPALQELLGVKEIPRTQALKQIWAYIKEKNLQDPENKKVIVCDEKLKTIFGGKERVGFLEISGLLNPHFSK